MEISEWKRRAGKAFHTQEVLMDVLIAFGTDDGRNLKRDHVGKSKYFYVYRFSDDEEEFFE